MIDPKRKLLWVGGSADDGCFFASRTRDSDLERVAALTTGHLLRARGVIVAIDQGMHGALLNAQTASLLRQAVCHGAKVIITCTVADAPHVAIAVREWHLKESVEIALRGEEIASIEKIARHPETPTVNDSLKIESSGKLGDEEIILLKRAFSDCSAVKLVRQTAGSSKVFCVFASLRNSRVGPIPLPFFVKFDAAAKIARELVNYRECTTLHIPFNQRPNLESDRCLIGHSTGIIVGNFVEQSESLSSVVDRGAGRAPLHSLFDGALRGWRRQAFYDTRYVWETNILRQLGLTCPSSYSETRRKRLNQRAREIGSGVSGFEELEALLSGLPAIRYRFGTTHGDLHGDNIRVAGTDAILIDFASIAEGPLTVDPGALDVSLVTDTGLVGGDAWIDLADSVFSIAALRPPAVPPRPEHPCAHLLDALQYVRQVAFATQFNDLEYPVVVALQLMRKASYRGRDKEHEHRRNHAYYLANGLIKEIVAATAAPTKTAA